MTGNGRAAAAISSDQRGAAFGTNQRGAALGTEPSSSGCLSEGEQPTPICVLIVDDDPSVRRAASRFLGRSGIDVTEVPSGAAALEHLHTRTFDILLSDIAMPGLDGFELLRAVRHIDVDIPVVFMTGAPTVSTAVRALECGAYRYITKPIDGRVLLDTVEKGASLRRMAHRRRLTTGGLDGPRSCPSQRVELDESFDRFLVSLEVAYQPIVAAPHRRIFGFEALLRSDEPRLPHADAVLKAAEQLNRLTELGRRIRRCTASALSLAPDDTLIFANLHVTDLLDPDLFDPVAPLSQVADRVVLEITERASIEDVSDAKAKVALLREMGFRIAVDDLGAGYAGLQTFALLEPDFVKLDMSLVRDVHKSKTKERVIRSMVSLCQDMGMTSVAEGVECADEGHALLELGCDLLQGYLYSRPGPAFPEVDW